MSAVVDVVKIETRLERTWRQYVEAKRRADQTLSMEDGILAGRAWAAWLAEFEGPKE
jgi:hypothetical protein